MIKEVDENREIIGLKQLLKDNDMTVRDLSLRMGVTTQTVYSWTSEKGRDPSIENQHKMCKILKTNLYELGFASKSRDLKHTFVAVTFKAQKRLKKYAVENNLKMYEVLSDLILDNLK